MFFKKKTPQFDADGNPMPQRKKRHSLITGIVVGGAVGSVLSLLFAPARGSKTRAKVAKTGKQIWKKSSTKAEIFLDKYKDKINDQIDK